MTRRADIVSALKRNPTAFAGRLGFPLLTDLHRELNDPAKRQGRSTCYGCGRSGMVRVLADSGYPIKTEMSTVRVPPDGWEWRFADGMPRWVCDECLGVSDE